MTKWTRSELEDALIHLFKVTDICFASEPRDLTEWYECYTQDVLWHDLGFGFNNGLDREIQGLDAVHEWMEGHNAIYPQSEMKYWPVAWYIIDEKRGWACCEWRNRMRDPGTGEIFEEKNYSKFIYAGNRKWSYEVDIYNPIRMRMMMEHWRKARDGLAAKNIALPPINFDWGLKIAEPRIIGVAEANWTHEEIDKAFNFYINASQEAFDTHRPEIHAQCFSDAAVYSELGFGFNGGWETEIQGYQKIYDWLKMQSVTYPNCYQQPGPINWYMIDAERGWVVYECLNQMRNLENGKILQTRSFSRMEYDGNNRWRFKEDVYNPLDMRDIFLKWREIHKNQ